MIRHLLTILKAWYDSLTGGIPRNPSMYPEWYKQRLDICGSCEFNTLNMTKDQLDKAGVLKTALGDKRGRCSLCGCFIKEKAWVRSEKCSLGEEAYKKEGYYMRWDEVDEPSNGSKEFNVESLNPELFTVGTRNEGFDYELNFVKPIKVGTEMELKFTLNSKKPIEIGSPQLSCGCLKHIGFDVKDRRNTICRLTVSTKDFPSGQFVRSILVRYSDDLKARKKGLRIYVTGVVEE